MDFVDYYDVMGLKPEAQATDIKQAYRKLARKYHPDVGKAPDSEERFKELGEAYNVLKDPERRKEYDELRAHRQADGSFDIPPGWQQGGPINPDDFTAEDAAGFSDFFEQVFGNRVRPRYSAHEDHSADVRGQDIQTRLSITLRDAFNGASVDLSLRSPTMHDDGSIRYEQRHLTVKIPAGVHDGQKLRLRGQGGPGIGSAVAGDLYITLNIEQDPLFHLDGNDITVHLPVTPWEAALGESVQVPTLQGAVKMNLPKNATTGKRLRLKGRGLPGNTPGDQYVVLSVVIPEVQNDEQRKAYEALGRLWSVDPRSELGV